MSMFLKMILALALILSAATLIAQSPPELMTSIEVSSVKELRQALITLAPTGGKIMVARGRYVVDEPIIITANNVSIEGTGSDTEFVLADHSNCPVFFVGSLEVPAKTIYEKISISKIRIEGNSAKQDRETWNLVGREWFTNNGITVRNVADSEFSDILVEDAISGGIVFAERCLNIHLSRITARKNVFDGIAWDGEVSLCSISDSTLSNNGAAGLSLDIGPEQNYFSKLRLIQNGTSGLFMRDSRNCDFWNCAFIENKEDGVFIANSEDQKRGSSGHTFRSCEFSSNGAYGFAQKGDKSTDILLLNPIFRDNAGGTIDQSFPELAPVQSRFLN